MAARHSASTAMSMPRSPPWATPRRPLARMLASRREVATRALEGMQSNRCAAPPSTSASTSVTAAPSAAATPAAAVPAGPPPMMTRRSGASLTGEDASGSARAVGGRSPAAAAGNLVGHDGPGDGGVEALRAAGHGDGDRQVARRHHVGRQPLRLVAHQDGERPRRQAEGGTPPRTTVATRRRPPVRRASERLHPSRPGPEVPSGGRPQHLGRPRIGRARTRRRSPARRRRRSGSGCPHCPGRPPPRRPAGRPGRAGVSTGITITATGLCGCSVVARRRRTRSSTSTSSAPQPAGRFGRGGVLGQGEDPLHPHPGGQGLLQQVRALEQGAPHLRPASGVVQASGPLAPADCGERRRRQAQPLDFPDAPATSWPKAFGSRTARSASILRSTSISAAFRSAIRRE